MTETKMNNESANKRKEASTTNWHLLVVHEEKKNTQKTLLMSASLWAKISSWHIISVKKQVLPSVPQHLVKCISG
jgi:hypothetical protein